MALVDMETPYPKRGKHALAKLCDSGDLVVKRHRHEDNVIRLESDGTGRHWEWNCRTEPSPIEWMRPIRKTVIDE
jgi:hypothetical protein